MLARHGGSRCGLILRRVDIYRWFIGGLSMAIDISAARLGSRDTDVVCDGCGLAAGSVTEAASCTSCHRCVVADGGGVTNDTVNLLNKRPASEVPRAAPRAARDKCPQASLLLTTAVGNNRPADRHKRTTPGGRDGPDTRKPPAEIWTIFG